MVMDEWKITFELERGRDKRSATSHDALVGTRLQIPQAHSGIPRDLFFKR
jgi:hypothetical protein